MTAHLSTGGSGGEEDLQPEIVEEDEEIEVESEEEDIRAVEPPAPATPLLSNRRIISPEPDSFDIPSSLLVRGGDKSSSRALQNSLPHSKDAYISAQKLPLRMSAQHCCACFLQPSRHFFSEFYSSSFLSLATRRSLRWI